VARDKAGASHHVIAVVGDGSLGVVGKDYRVTNAA
jgi:deoxyxylulose-5-phosphate synthase